MPPSDSIVHRLHLYVSLTRFDRPVGTLLLLWPTLAALWIAADGHPSVAHVAIFVLGTLLMRSAGCAINDVVDRDFDGHVKRTSERVVSRGLVAPREAIGVFLVLLALSALLLLPLNALTFWLALLGSVVAVTYPFFKRFFALPQAYLAIAFSFGVPMAFAAVQQTVPATGWWLFAANLFWVVAYDTEYAMVDRDDDLRLGVRSSAIWFGRADVAAVMTCYALYFALLVVVAVQIDAGLPMALGIGVGLAFALYHYRLIRYRDRAACFDAFRGNQWVGLAVFAGIALDYALR